VLADAAVDRGLPLLPLGLPLSEHLASVPSGNWDRAADAFTVEWIRAQRPGPAVVTRIDLLFEPRLKIEPLALLTRASRFCPLIVGWPGDWDGRALAYAIPSHRHFKTWSRPAAEIRPLA
jgi:hypothetical protein